MLEKQRKTCVSYVFLCNSDLFYLVGLAIPNPTLVSWESRVQQLWFRLSKGASQSQVHNSGLYRGSIGQKKLGDFQFFS